MLLEAEEDPNVLPGTTEENQWKNGSPPMDDFDYVIHSHRRLFDFPVKQIWESRELLYFLVWRDLKMRYKQALIGAGWAVIKPLMMMLVFVVVFGLFVKVPTGDIPYSVFVYTGLLPWTFVSTIISIAAASLITNSPLLKKIYFPRLLIPLSSSITSLVDLAISLPLLFGLMVWFQVPFSWRVIVVPILILLMFLLSFGIGLLMAALHVKYHDVGMLLPIMLQVWMYASPVIYPIELVSERWLPLYSLNPLVGMFQAFRWALLDAQSPTPLMLVSSIAWTLVILASGIIFFHFSEDTFADVV